MLFQSRPVYDRGRVKHFAALKGSEEKQHSLWFACLEIKQRHQEIQCSQYCPWVNSRP